YTSYIEEKIIKNSKALLCHLYLSYPMYCPNCKALMLHNGTKVVNNIHLSSAGKKLVLSIRKQKYLCPECKKTATAKFKDTNYRSEEHTSELQSRFDLICRLLLEKTILSNEE